MTSKQFSAACFWYIFQEKAWDGFDNWPGINASVCIVVHPLAATGAAVAGAAVAGAGAAVVAAGPQAVKTRTTKMKILNNVSFFMVLFSFFEWEIRNYMFGIKTRFGSQILIDPFSVLTSFLL
jgi:hypothetical protein